MTKSLVVTRTENGFKSKEVDSSTLNITKNLDSLFYIRAKRDALLKEIEWRFNRYNSEIRQGLSPTDDIGALDTYAQELRDIPQNFKTPEEVVWPVYNGSQ